MQRHILLYLEALKLLNEFNIDYGQYPLCLTSRTIHLDLNSAMLLANYKKNVYGCRNSLGDSLKELVSTERIDILLYNTTSLSTVHTDILRGCNYPALSKLKELDDKYSGDNYGTLIKEANNKFYEKNMSAQNYVYRWYEHVIKSIIVNGINPKAIRDLV